MVDAQAAILTYLESKAALSAVQCVAGLNMPPKGYKPSDGSLIVFKVRGGTPAYETDHLFPSVQFKCYAATETAAMTLYGLLSDNLHHQSGVGVKWAEIETLGQPLREPQTGWPYVLAFFNVTIANQ